MRTTWSKNTIITADGPREAVMNQHEQRTMNMNRSQVYEYAVQHGLDYHYCQPCDADTPTYNQTCLICGSFNGQRKEGL